VGGKEVRENERFGVQWNRMYIIYCRQVNFTGTNSKTNEVILERFILRNVQHCTLSETRSAAEGSNSTV
jgi:hypothetical protein